jgi:ATP-dependent helicase HrpA
MAADFPRLDRRLRKLRRDLAASKDVKERLEQLRLDVQASVDRRDQRQATIPEVAFPAELPICSRVDDISAAIATNQVVIVCGETGSGKSTQLPKLCLKLGRGVAGLIGHTQPRRIAARTVADRVAFELGAPGAGLVAHKIRFSDATTPDTRIKLMTDGILLTEIPQDRRLLQYDTLIIDEAHERSLNIDVVLGYLKRVLPRRRDLKLIITSATIDPQRFSQHFDNAPIIEVSGRSYPVEIRYQPPIGANGEAESTYYDGLVSAVEDLVREGPGDILVFLPGERQIREAAQRLRRSGPTNLQSLALFARLSNREQQQIFAPHGERRVVLATNVAETSLTVPGIRYVIDTGLARIARYSAASRVRRLPIEAISQASAQQRAGRCGRLGPGIAVRLYSEADYGSRPSHTDPEIKRTSLASVILQLKDLGIDNVDEFPFLDAPQSRNVRDGFLVLQALGALDTNGDLTETGRQLARLPLDPRIGRMLLAADRLDCLRPVLIIASALSIQDPRDRPQDARAQADAAHERFADPRSDFLWFKNLWMFYADQRRRLSVNQMRKLCRQNFLSYPRMRDWQDVHEQLRAQAKDLGLKVSGTREDYVVIHRAVLSGLIDSIGQRDEQDYRAPRNKRFRIHPGSQVCKRPPWVVAAEIVETEATYARVVAAIEPEWLLDIAPHLLKRHYSDPSWDSSSGRVLASERITLYGLTVSSRRRVDYARIDPAAAREVFISEALVAGELDSEIAFYRHNQAVRASIEALEHRGRRRDIAIDDRSLHACYDAALPWTVVDLRTLESWYAKAAQQQRRQLEFSSETLLAKHPDAEFERNFPAHLKIGQNRFELHYWFEPGHAQDGATVRVPLTQLPQVDSDYCDWLLPVFLEAKVTQLLKNLPKALRRGLVPIPDTAKAICEQLKFGEGRLTQSVAAELKELCGLTLGPEDLDISAIDDHLRLNFCVIDEAGTTLAEGRVLEHLRAELSGQLRQSIKRFGPWQLERNGITRWDFDHLPEKVQRETTDGLVIGYPALMDDGDSVAIRVYEDAETARTVTDAGLRKLVMLSCPKLFRYARRNLPGFDRMALHFAAAGRADELGDDLLQAALESAFELELVLPRNRSEFDQALAKGEASFLSTQIAIADLIGKALQDFFSVRKALNGPSLPTSAHADITMELDGLIYPGFIRATPIEWRGELQRYLRALQKRIDKLPGDAQRDARLTALIDRHYQRYLQAGYDLRDSRRQSLAVQHYRWMLEEYRVSCFAQELGTKGPISEQRLDKQWAKCLE